MYMSRLDLLGSMGEFKRSERIRWSKGVLSNGFVDILASIWIVVIG